MNGSIYTSHGLRGMVVGGVPLAWHQGSVSRADGAVQEAFGLDGQPHALISCPQHEMDYISISPTQSIDFESHRTSNCLV
jgi:hypothetical protein